GTIGNALAVFQVLFHHRVVLHALEFIKGADVRIAVRQVRNQTDHNLVIFGVIQEKTTGRTGFAQRPAGTVQYQAFFMVGRVNIPQLFDTRSEEHTSELQSRENLVCRLLLEKKKKKDKTTNVC